MATLEGLVLDGLALNDNTNFRIQGFEPGVAPKRWQWISGDDADGAVLPEEAHYDNAEMNLRIRISPQVSMDAALAKIGQIVDKLQECEQQPLGLAATWTPAGSTKTLTAYVLGGEVEGIPITTSGEDQGWYLRNPAPVVNLKLYRRPFLYGTEVTSAATLTDTNPAQILTVGGVTGDVPAEARLVVTDAATQSRRHIEWGLEWRYYNAATSLILDSDNLVITGFAGTGTTLAGAYDPGAAGNSVITATLRSPVQAVCGTGNLSHVGTFRVKARCNVSATTTRVRLSYQDGDGIFSANPWATPAVAGWTELDLGIVTIDEKVLGTQKWSGRIEGYTTAGAANAGGGGGTATDTLYVDYLVLIPVAEGYGKARAAYTYTAGVQNAHDEFTTIAAGTALNTRTAAAGGTWATSGATTDFAAADAPTATEETETRATTADAAGGRFAILGATNFTDTEAEVAYYRTAAPANFYQGVIVRWVDASNHLRLTSDGAVTKVIAGVATQIATLSTPNTALSVWRRLRVVVFGSGAGSAYSLDATGSVLSSVAFQDATLATGGTLATGKPGFVDYNGAATASTRYYDNFSHSTPAAEPIVAYSGRAAEIRSDGAIRQDSTGVYYGDVPSYRGAKFFLSPAGDEARTSRILVKTRRNDLDTGLDDSIADSTTVTIHYTPRWSTVPR